jgi:hypothetical protein
VTTPGALTTPPFPDHPAGHGCLSGAVLNTMADFFGTDKVEFDVVSGRTLDGQQIPARHFERFSYPAGYDIIGMLWSGARISSEAVPLSCSPAGAPAAGRKTCSSAASRASWSCAPSGACAGRGRGARRHDVTAELRQASRELDAGPDPELRVGP